MGYGGLRISSGEERLWLGVLFAAAALLVWARPGTTWTPLDLIPERWSSAVALTLLIVGACLGLSGEFG